MTVVLSVGLHCTAASQSQAKRSITPDGQAWQAARKAVHLSPPSSPLPTAAGADGSGFNGTAAGPLSSALPPAASRPGQPPTPPIAVPQQPSSGAAANRRPSPSFSAGSSSSGGVSGSQVGHSRQRSNERIPRPRKNLTPQERLEAARLSSVSSTPNAQWHMGLCQRSAAEGTHPLSRRVAIWTWARLRALNQRPRAGTMRDT